MSEPGTADYHEQLLTKLLASVFGELDDSAAALLRDRLRWIAIAGGQTLMAQGEPGDSMYLLVSGRLRAYVLDDDGAQRMVREMARGQIIGEMSLYHRRAALRYRGGHPRLGAGAAG